MLKITNINDGRMTTFKLEGKLIGEWVNILRNCWQQATLSGEVKATRVDLTSVNWVSDEGKALLREMYCGGVELLAANLLLAGIIAEICVETTD
jgi:hypothetical protein